MTAGKPHAYASVLGVDGRRFRVSNAFDPGLHGVEVAPGDHLCGLYTDASERDRVLVPFLQSGLLSGDKCICVVDGTEPTEIVAALGIDIDATVRTVDKQLEVIRASDMYLRSGTFSAAEVLSSWKATISEAMYDGRFNVVRAIETWSLRDVVPDTRELLVLESEMNRYLPLYPQVVVCMYDVGRFGGGIVIDLLKTHSRVLFGGMVLENPYSLNPDDLLAGAESDLKDEMEDEREEMAAWCYAVTTGST